MMIGVCRLWPRWKSAVRDSGSTSAYKSFHVLTITVTQNPKKMGAYYDEIEIEDMAWDDEKRVYHYPCPCGDRFEISRRQLADCEDIATCPSCSLIIRVIYDPVCFVVGYGEMI